MGGKGRRRREKNFLAAHGGYTRLPPPPKPEELDFLPSKLRKIMELTTTAPTKPSAAKGFPKSSEVAGGKKKQKEKPRLEDALRINTSEFKGGQDLTALKHKDNREEVVHTDIHDKKKAKRKRKQVHDLRFESKIQDLGIVGSKKRDRKKKYLEERKNKHKKAKVEKNLDFPGREEIKFGDIVVAPPKLIAFPKALKTTQSASHERIRLQTVEAYRNRKGWVSRPGIHIPTPVDVTPSS